MFETIFWALVILDLFTVAGLIVLGVRLWKACNYIKCLASEHRWGYPWIDAEAEEWFRKCEVCGHIERGPTG